MNLKIDANINEIMIHQDRDLIMIENNELNEVIERLQQIKKGLI